MNLQVWAILLAVGFAGGWRVTSWAYDASYKAEVEQGIAEHTDKTKESERIIRESLLANQKTKIIYRTIKEKADAITITTCLDDDGYSLHRETTTEANATKAGKPADSMSTAADALRERLKSRPD